MARTILISGASGLIGSALTEVLEQRGDRVRRLVRREPRGSSEVRWHPERRELPIEALDGIDVVVNLAGETIGRRWTSARRRGIRDSRIDATGAIGSAIAKASHKPATMISGSAVGFYGDRGDDPLDERQPAGRGFLAEVCQEWEATAKPVSEQGTRVVLMRTGLVLAKQGGALKQMLPPFRAGVGGRLGNGQQWMSWIALPDLVRAILWLMDHSETAGPVNMCAPEPIRNSDFTRALGLELHRPTVFPVPAFVLRAIFGEMADETLLVSQRAIPAVLSASGFQFEYPSIIEALARVL